MEIGRKEDNMNKEDRWKLELEIRALKNEFIDLETKAHLWYVVLAAINVVGWCLIFAL